MQNQQIKLEIYESIVIDLQNKNTNTVRIFKTSLKSKLNTNNKNNILKTFVFESIVHGSYIKLL